MTGTPSQPAPAVDDAQAPDEPISTTDYKADEPETKAEETPEEPEVKADEPEVKEPEKTEPPEEPKVSVDDLRAQIEELKSVIAAKEAAEKEAAEHAAKVEALKKADIPDMFARFLSGDKDSWQEQINALTTLRGQASTAPAAPSVPRDPAVDADLETEDEGLAEALEFFGFSD
nr:MAG TPA: hypothetical protein [Caudoviricetes sp.]